MMNGGGDSKGSEHMLHASDARTDLLAEAHPEGREAEEEAPPAAAQLDEAAALPVPPPPPQPEAPQRERSLSPHAGPSLDWVALASPDWVPLVAPRRSPSLSPRARVDLRPLAMPSALRAQRFEERRAAQRLEERRLLQNGRNANVNARMENDDNVDSDSEPEN